MSEIIKITSTVEARNRIQNALKKPADAVFELGEAALTQELTPVEKTEERSIRQEMLRHLNREFYLPLLSGTKVQADSLRKLVLYAKLFEVSSGVSAEDFFDEFFVYPERLLEELLAREEGGSLFQGEFFDLLRALVRNEEQPKLQDAIVSLLKSYDCRVTRLHALKGISANLDQLIQGLNPESGEVLLPHGLFLLSAIREGDEDFPGTNLYIKDQLVPDLRKALASFPPGHRLHDVLRSLIHQVVRYDRGAPQLLEETFVRFADELKPLLPSLAADDLLELKEALFAQADQSIHEARGLVPLPALHPLIAQRLDASSPQVAAPAAEEEDQEISYIYKEEKDMAALLEKALDRQVPARMSSTARNLLATLIQSESPGMPLAHFLVPVRFQNENTYGEFFIDKVCKRRKGNAQKAFNVFFTIQSDLYGTFEVDLLALDGNIQLELRCPGQLLEAVQEQREAFRAFIEDAGYRMAGYRVGEYEESDTVLARFPGSASKKVGLDVKV